MPVNPPAAVAVMVPLLPLKQLILTPPLKDDTLLVKEIAAEGSVNLTSTPVVVQPFWSLAVKV